MAQNAVNAVLQAFQRSMEQVQAIRAAKQQREEFQARLEAERTEREENKKFREDQLKENQRQFDVQKEASEKLFNLRKTQFDQEQAQTEYNQAVQSQQSGINVPGAVTVPGLQPTAEQPLVPTGAENTQVIFPTGHTLSVPPLSQSPLVQYQQGEKRAEEAARLKQALSEKEAEAMRALDVAKMNHQYRMEELESTHDAASKLADKNNANSLNIARIRSSASGYDESNILPDIIQGGAVGSISQEDLRKKFPPKEVAAYNRVAGEQGYQFLPQKKMEQVAALEQMGNLIPHIRNMLNIRYKHPLAVQTKYTDAGREFNAEIANIKSAAPQASVALSGVRRFTQSELERFDQLFIPDIGVFTSSPEANLIKLNKFEDDLTNAIDIVTKGLTPQQTEMIKLGLRSKGLRYTKDRVQNEQQAQSGQPQTQPSKGLKIWRINPQTKQLEQVEQ